MKHTKFTNHHMSRSRQGSKHSILCQYLPFDLFSENHTKHGVLSVNYKSTLTEEYHAFLVFYGIFSFLFSHSSVKLWPCACCVKVYILHRWARSAPVVCTSRSTFFSILLPSIFTRFFYYCREALNFMGLSWKKMSNVEEYTHNIPMSGAFLRREIKYIHYFSCFNQGGFLYDQPNNVH